MAASALRARPSSFRKPRNHHVVSIPTRVNNINGQTKDQVAQRAAEAARIATKKAETAAKKAAAEQEAADLEATFELCQGGCKCGMGDDCLAKGLVRCEMCSGLKKALKSGQFAGRADCRVRACVDARTGPLLLGFNGEQGLLLP